MQRSLCRHIPLECFAEGNVQETSEKGTAATYVAAEGDFEHIRFIYD